MSGSQRNYFWTFRNSAPRSSIAATGNALNSLKHFDKTLRRVACYLSDSSLPQQNGETNKVGILKWWRGDETIVTASTDRDKSQRIATEAASGPNSWRILSRFYAGYVQPIQRSISEAEHSPKIHSFTITTIMVKLTFVGVMFVSLRPYTTASATQEAVL